MMELNGADPDPLVGTDPIKDSVTDMSEVFNKTETESEDNTEPNINTKVNSNHHVPASMEEDCIHVAKDTIEIVDNDNPFANNTKTKMENNVDPNVSIEEHLSHHTPAPMEDDCINVAKGTTKIVDNNKTASNTETETEDNTDPNVHIEENFNQHILSYMENGYINVAKDTTEIADKDNPTVSNSGTEMENNADSNVCIEENLSHHVKSAVEDDCKSVVKDATDTVDNDNLTDSAIKQNLDIAAEGPKEIMDKPNPIVFTKHSSNNHELSTGGESINGAKGTTELKIMETFHITSSRTHKTNLEARQFENNVSETSDNTPGMSIELNHYQTENDEVIDALPKEIQAELTAHAEYHRLKSISADGYIDLRQHDIRNNRKPGCNSTSSPIINKTIKTEMYGNEFEQCLYNSSKTLASDTTYFGSESSTFFVSNASASLSQVSQDLVIEELPVSNELNELGLDDNYLQGLTQGRVKEDLASQKHAVKSTHINNKSRGKARKVPTNTETTLVDSSSISKIKSLWAKICTSPKVSNNNDVTPKKRGRPKGSGNAQKKTIHCLKGFLGNNKNDDAGKENNRCVTKIKKQKESKLIKDSQLLKRFKITPCKVRLQRLDVSDPTVFLSPTEGINKKTNGKDKKVKELKPVVEKSACIKTKDRISKGSDQSDKNAQNSGNQAKKDKPMAKLLKEERNDKIVEMKLKMENSVTDITFFDDIETDDGNDDMNASEDEYTPTNNSSLKTAFVKSSKSKRGIKIEKGPIVKRKIEFLDTKEGLKKRSYKKKGTKRIGAPPVIGHFECNKCDFKANEKNLVEKHYKREHALSWKSCHYCDRQFKSQDCLLEHEAKLHTKGKPFSCSFEGCLYASNNRVDLSRHQSKHATEKTHKCPKCDFLTKWRKNLRHHLLLVHTDERKFKCNLCKYTCKRNQDLKQHMFRHTDYKPIECLTCGFKVKTNWELKSHKLSHSIEKPFKCTHEGCEASTKTNADLLKHIRHVHTADRNFICALCGKGYKDQFGLNKHHSYVHVATRSFKCDICNKAFKCKPALKKHILFHGGFKPHKCPVCQKRFAVRAGMKKHMETHDFKFRPYRCPICPYGARQPDHLLTHIGSFHGDSYCYFCELCNKPFGRYGMLQYHYRRMHKSDLPKHTNGNQIDLALVKMEMELQEEDSKRRKSKKGKRNSNTTTVDKVIKEEPLDDGYESVMNTSDDFTKNMNSKDKASDDDMVYDTTLGLLKPHDKDANVNDPEHINKSSTSPEAGEQSNRPVGTTSNQNESIDVDGDLPQLEQNSEAVSSQQQENDEELDEGEDMSELVVNRNGSATLAIYNSLRLSLATKGFSFNYEKTGKKPDAWFMDVGCMNQKDATKQKTYLRKVAKRSRVRGEPKNLATFLKQRTVNRNNALLKSKLIKSIGNGPKRGRPCKKNTKAKYLELKTELREQKKGQPRKAKYKGKYLEFDTDDSALLFYENYNSESDTRPSEIKSKRTLEYANPPNMTEKADKIVTEPKRKRGRPKKVCQMNSSLQENESLESPGKKQANYLEFDTNDSALLFYENSESDTRPSEIKSERTLEYANPPNMTEKADKIVTEPKRKRGRPKKVCQMNSSLQENESLESPGRKQANYLEFDTNDSALLFYENSESDTWPSEMKSERTLEYYANPPNMTEKADKIVTIPKRKRGRPKKVCQMNSSLQENESLESPGRKQANYLEFDTDGSPPLFYENYNSESDTRPSEMKSERTLKYANPPNMTEKADKIVTIPKRKRGRPKKVCQMNLSLQENESLESPGRKQANLKYHSHEIKSDLLISSKPKEKVKHKRKFNTDNGEQETKKPKWQKKYIPVKMRKAYEKKDTSLQPNKKFDVGKIKPIPGKSKSKPKVPVELKTSDTLCTSQKQESVILGKGGNSKEQKEKSNTSGTSCGIPDLTNFCDDVLALTTYENIGALIGDDNVKVAQPFGHQNSQPTLSNGNDASESDSLGVHTNYLNYKIYLNVPDNPEDTFDDSEHGDDDHVSDNEADGAGINDTLETGSLRIKTEPAV